ncbi:MAG: serine protease [Zoogloeaceae bacterium]|nr:serine protease [Zoogloeaceae bacterium]
MMRASIPKTAFALCLGLFACDLQAQAEAASPGKARELSSAAERIFKDAQPRLLQIRTLLKSTQKQASLGSGFIVDARGLAMTNYHVVSRYALEPQTYQLKYAAADGTSGALRLYAIDVINDLAVVRLEAPPGARFRPFEFDAAAVTGKLTKGERLFSMGNPLDLGFGIVEGTYNGLVEKSYQARVHFTGALNSGMSGGPVVTLKNRVVGINVAKRVGGDLISFLVPAEAAHRLLEEARTREEMDAPGIRGEIVAQVLRWQDGFFSALKTEGFREVVFGSYRVPESRAAWFDCWSETNRNARPKPKSLLNESFCNTDTGIYLADDTYVGSAMIAHTHLKNVDFNAVQFARETNDNTKNGFYGWGRGVTAYDCREDFLSGVADMNRPVLRLTWCARAYHDFPGLYDFRLFAVTQDRNDEALISKLAMAGVSFEHAILISRDFLAMLKADHDLD